MPITEPPKKKRWRVHLCRSQWLSYSRGSVLSTAAAAICHVSSPSHSQVNLCFAVTACNGSSGKWKLLLTLCIAAPAVVTVSPACGEPEGSKGDKCPECQASGWHHATVHPLWHLPMPLSWPVCQSECRPLRASPRAILRAGEAVCSLPNPLKGL